MIPIITLCKAFSLFSDTWDNTPCVLRSWIFKILFRQVFKWCAICKYLCLVTQSCPTLCDPMDCSPSGSFVHGDSPGKNTGVGCHTLLQGIFPTQETESRSPALQADSLSFEPPGKPKDLIKLIKTQFSSFSYFFVVLRYTRFVPGNFIIA